jgi:uncharacterized protein (DUF1330 family)
MAKGYWIVRVSARNAERYPEYVAATRPAYEKYGARFLVRGGRCDTKEGTARKRTVVVEFKDYETALACYQSPEYQATKRSATPSPTQTSSLPRELRLDCL